MKTYPVVKNQEVEVTITDLSHEGMGIAKVDGYLLFVDNALPGEVVEIKVLKVGPKFGFAKVMHYIEKSAHRNEEINEDLLRTGIAPLSHLDYPSQLVFKQEQVENVMRKVAKMPDVTVLPTIGMDEPFGYRNKAQIPVQRIQGELTTGFYRKHSHTLVPMEDFFIQEKEIDEAIVTVRDILQGFGVKAYNEEAHEGFLRHIVVRRGHYSEEMMIVLVTKKTKFFQADKICDAITKALPKVVSIVQNVNEEKTNVILGPVNRVLFGKPYIEDQLLGKTYRISARSFYQINTVQAEELYNYAINAAGLKETDTVIDAYSGIGTIGLSLADKVHHVYGMEVVEEAVEDARTNAEINGIENATYLAGKAEKVMQQFAREGIQANVVFVDPPRKGLEANFIESTVQMKPEKVVYISCNPATMARDIALFADKGYKVKTIQPVDLFPQTHHVECVSVLVKK